MRRQELEIILSRTIQTFTEPKFNLEQYQTPPRVAANLLQRATELNDIIDKSVLDVCAGTGILGLGASLLGGKVSCMEIDQDAVNLLRQNEVALDVSVEIYSEDLFSFEPNLTFDTVISNPPFGIQQSKHRDLDFITESMKYANIGYFILDGSVANIERVPKLLQKKGINVLEMYKEEFPLTNTYPWHRLKRKIQQVIVIRVKN